MTSPRSNITTYTAAWNHFKAAEELFYYFPSETTRKEKAFAQIADILSPGFANSPFFWNPNFSQGHVET